MSSKNQERKSNVRIKKSEAKEASPNMLSSIFATVFGKSLFRQVATVVAILAAIFGFVLYRSTSQAIRDLVNAEPDTLKEAFFGETPHLFYCERGLGENKVGTIPSVYSDLNIIKGGSITFATVNCSQVLPSGKTIFDRFKLKKEWKPTIFGTAPWVKPVQVSPNSLGNVQSFKKFVEDSLAPKATVVKSDKHLWQHCALAKNIVYDDRDIAETCILMVKGTKFTSATAQLEQRLVQAFPRVKFAMIDAAKMRMTFEDPDGMPPDYFALKLHALRNGTHYQSMVNPITWDYLNTFVSSAVAAPLYDFQGDASQTIHAMKVKDLKARKEREAKRRATQEQSKSKKKTSSSETADESDPVVKPKKTYKAPKASEQSNKQQQKQQSPPPLKKKEDIEEIEKETKKASQSDDDRDESVDPSVTEEQQRLERERARREEMERQQREYLFESADSDDVDESPTENFESEEDEDDAVIEL